eukprot:12911237-Prorocentrum_lima.AAC.1
MQPDSGILDTLATQHNSSPAAAFLRASPAHDGTLVGSDEHPPSPGVLSDSMDGIDEHLLSPGVPVDDVEG